MDLRDKVAIVTGAGQGIGRAIALELGRRQARVVVADVNAETASQTAQTIEAEGHQAFAVTVDVSQRDQVQRMIDAALQRWGRIDVLVNNAGVGLGRKAFLDITPEDWRWIFAVHMEGTFHCTQLVAPIMIRQKRGSIINLSSVAALTGKPYCAAYAAAKAAIAGFTRSVATELAPHRINVNAIAPGLIETEMSRRAGNLDRAAEWVLWPRIGQPEDIAHLVAFLASDASEYITGQVISPNGGGWMG